MAIQQRKTAQAAAVVLGAAGTLMIYATTIDRGWRAPGPAPATAEPGAGNAADPGALAFEAAPEVGLLAVPDRFEPGDTLSAVLTRNGFARSEVEGAAAALGDTMNVRSLRAGQTVWLHRTEDGAPSRVELALDGFRSVSLDRVGAGWSASEQAARSTVRRDTVRGVLADNLYGSVERLGEDGALAMLMARSLEYDVDFYRDSRQGDRFSVVVDKVFVEERPEGYGDLQAIRYVNRGREVLAFRFEHPDGSSGYYDFEGKSKRRRFLRSPIAFGARISSGFSHRRLHPVHRVYRAHHGVDYAAPVGTPVLVTADGVVTDAGMRGPNGNMVTVTHSSGYMTRYLHLSRIPKSVRAGRRVTQKDVIGYVGATGTATGPHLDYRMYRHGKALDSRRHVIPPGPPIPDELLSRFREQRDALLLALRAGDRAEPDRDTRVADGGAEN